MRWVEHNLVLIGIIAVFTLLVAVIGSFAGSAPPNSFTILTGRSDGAYYAAAKQYQKIAAQKGFDLKIKETAGSVEALQMLEEGQGDAAFVEGGVALNANLDRVGALAAVFYEPVWISYQKELAPGEPLDTLSELKGMRIGVSEPGSGSNVLSLTLLKDAGVDGTNAEIFELPAAEGVRRLKAGQLDAMILVSAPTSNNVQAMITDPGLELMSLRRTDAYLRRQRFLRSLTLPEGTIDLANNIPRNDIEMVSTVANLMVRNDLHPDLVRLLTIAAVQTHQVGGLFEDRLEFPNVKDTDVPVSSEELAYLMRIKNGDTSLDRYLPFWAASLLDRYLLFVLPLLLIVLPYLGRSPFLYQFFMRSRVNRWYKTVHEIELRADRMQQEELQAAIVELDELDDRIAHELNVSNWYMPSVYDLRLHIQYVKSLLQRRVQRLLGQGDNAAIQTQPATPTT